MPNSQLEKPIYGYLVITVALVVGMVSASVFGQPPKDLPPESATTQLTESVSTPQVKHSQPSEQDFIASTPTNIEFVVSHPRKWILGVRINDTSLGAVVTSVVPMSAAENAGLESGDRIIAVDGQQVGWVGGQTVSLHHLVDASPNGVARILVQKRSSNLKVVLVRLQTLGESLGMNS
ncbi:PDZ domain-containing protein [Stieleria sp. JC731]|uniref:PDZ domain-containing protein n=1 Tax=Pirellulaceae TaxID=2691357 RepID=UPI001E362EB2|nr:PDZ domain-containing protein [Stieleria sp. JC731]MCC9600214.1 PDZ domain-containing protein [Stieleria sp. JC731]